MSTLVVTIRGGDVPGVGPTFALLGLDLVRVGRVSPLTVCGVPIGLGHLAIQGSHLPQPRGVLPVLGMAHPIDLVNQGVHLVGPRGVLILRIGLFVASIRHHVAGIGGGIPGPGFRASGIVRHVTRFHAHRGPMRAGYREGPVRRRGSGPRHAS